MEPSMAHIIRQSIIKEPWSSLIYSPSLFASVSQLQTFSFFWKSFISWLKTWSHWLAYHIQGCYVFAKLFWKGCFVPLGKFSCFCGFCVLLQKCKSFEIEKRFRCILYPPLHSSSLPISIQPIGLELAEAVRQSRRWSSVEAGNIGLNGSKQGWTDRKCCSSNSSFLKLGVSSISYIRLRWIVTTRKVDSRITKGRCVCASEIRWHITRQCRRQLPILHLLIGLIN